MFFIIMGDGGGSCRVNILPLGCVMSGVCAQLLVGDGVVVRRGSLVASFSPPVGPAPQGPPLLSTSLSRKLPPPVFCRAVAEELIKKTGLN